MKNYIYNLMIRDVSNHCYENCLDYVSHQAAVLDVGIGNGVMLKNYHPLIKSKALKITGIDINRYYLTHCQGLIEKYGLEKHIEIHCTPVEQYRPLCREYFDFILFTMSFMLFNDPCGVLKRIKGWLKPGGEIIFFQTIYKNRWRLMEFIKPRLKYLTTVDFGIVTYEKNFLEILKGQNLTVVEDRLIKREWYKGEYRMLATTIQGETGSAEIT
ncbi:MAG: class I SAM-dependent methyltransferase [Thermodesulfobacteriota bacterium]